MDVNPYQPTPMTEASADATGGDRRFFLLRAIVSGFCALVSLVFAGLGLLVYHVAAAHPVQGLVVWLFTVSTSFAFMGGGVATGRLRIILAGVALLLVAFFCVVALILSGDWLPDQK